MQEVVCFGGWWWDISRFFFYFGLSMDYVCETLWLFQIPLLVQRLFEHLIGFSVQFASFVCLFGSSASTSQANYIASGITETVTVYAEQKEYIKVLYLNLMYICIHLQYWGSGLDQLVPTPSMCHTPQLRFVRMCMYSLWALTYQWRRTAQRPWTTNHEYLKLHHKAKQTRGSQRNREPGARPRIHQKQRE